MKGLFRRGKRRRRRHHSWFSWLLARIAIACAVVFIVLPVCVILILRWVPPAASSFMIQAQVSALVSRTKGWRLHYAWTGWNRISPNARIAVVAAEDQKFPFHHGFDVQAIEEAREEYERGERLRGASTISQQVAKNLFLWPGRSFVRKGLEAWLTVLLEWLWPKRRILEVYLNVAEFGPGAYGVGAASRLYFNKSPAQLTEHEAALLAAVLPNPERLHADRPSSYVSGRADWIVGQMRRLGGEAYLRGM